MNVYDFDKTIYDGDSSIDFFKYCLKINKKCLIVLPKLSLFVCLYLIKIIEKEKLKSCFFSIIKYFKDIDKVVSDFWNYKKYKLKDFYLKQKKNSDIVISASPEFLLMPVANKYGFSLIATKVNKNNGRLIGNNCYGEEKVKRLKKEKNIDIFDRFYSDSLSDYPLALLAKKSFIVLGDKLIDWNKFELKGIKKIKNLFINRDFITFCAIGLINVFNGIWIAYAYSLLMSDPIIAYILGFLTSLCIAYILNSIFNFKIKLKIVSFIKFVINNIPNFIIQVLSVVVLIKLLIWPKLLSYSISAVISVPITFLLVKANVFKKNND